MSNQVEELYEVASQMLDKAYCPYSNFPVGAALLTEDGQVFSGCNIENSALGLCHCAERTAIHKAVSEGYYNFKSLVVTGKTDRAISPCGACRQVMSEFFDENVQIVLTNQAGAWEEMTIDDLLPGRFTGQDMEI